MVELAFPRSKTSRGRRSTEDVRNGYVVPRCPKICRLRPPKYLITPCPKKCLQETEFFFINSWFPSGSPKKHSFLPFSSMDISFFLPKTRTVHAMTENPPVEPANVSSQAKWGFSPPFECFLGGIKKFPQLICLSFITASWTACLLFSCGALQERSR